MKDKEKKDALMQFDHIMLILYPDITKDEHYWRLRRLIELLVGHSFTQGEINQLEKFKSYEAIGKISL